MTYADKWPPLYKRTDQPAPLPGEGDVWAELIEAQPPGAIRDAMTARRTLGIERYGQPLQRGDGRDHRRDLAEEILDACAYAQSIGRADIVSALVELLGDLDRPRKAAPPWVDHWVDHGGRLARGAVAQVQTCLTGGCVWSVWTDDMRRRSGICDTLAEAKAAADAVLLADGWTLS